jgi:hypothetical protein
MMKKIAMLITALLLLSLVCIPQETRAQDDENGSDDEEPAPEPTWWDNLLGVASDIGAPSPQGLSAPGSGSPSTAPAASEAVRTTASWHLAEGFYNRVVYYAFFAQIEVMRNVVGGIARVFMGV